MDPTGTGQEAGSRPAKYMFTALQTTHQHADAKAGILAAVQAGLVGTSGGWSRRAMSVYEQGGAAGVLAGTLSALFICGLVGGAVSLAAVLYPRILREAAGNRYSFVHLASGPDIVPAADAPPEESADGRELSQTVRFLAGVAVRKYRRLVVAVVCTAVMGVTAGLGVVVLPVLA
ncbi:hypothetical protein [Streptomyces sp. 4R-3d]|uniref:hypothetical protein n=1 Tax=Streptomyces sp. 4R-3d TaxID=2559605 RepID=UPI001072186C|nr:hypothetical protein [Streptomyces sp. 4R-3d]TFI25615.1 hypothetical protein E4P36_19500 [Streptomyces sp. 4R-3d]